MYIVSNKIILRHRNAFTYIIGTEIFFWIDIMLYTWFDDVEQRYCYQTAQHISKQYIGEG